MNFTATPPTTPGAYWFKNFEDSVPNIAEVYWHVDSLFYLAVDSKPRSVNLSTCLWSPRLVPVDEVEKAWEEGRRAHYKLNGWSTSHARRVVEGEEQV